MVWKAEPIKHLLEITSINNSGGEYSHSQEFTPEKYLTDISLSLFDDDKEIRVKPYTIEHLTHLVEEDYETRVVNELFVGIRNGTRIAYVGTFYTLKEVRGKRIEQYFFHNDKPGSCNLGVLCDPGWLRNQSPVLDEKLTPYFIALKEIRPNVTDSLDRCMEHLTRPGPEYTGRSDGTFSF